MQLLDKEKLLHNIDKIALYDLTNNNVFGSSYFVYQKGTLTLKKHFGSTDSDGTTAVNDSTMYRIASMTKPITAAAALILVDRGLISLDDPVSKYIPEFENIHVITTDGVDLGNPKTPVNIMHCLTHTSGFGCEKYPENADEKYRKTILDTVTCNIDAGLDFEPFTKQMYSLVIL